MSAFQSGKLSAAERNLNQIQGNKVKEMESIKNDLQTKELQVEEAKKKASAAKARTDTLEVQLKDIK